MVGLRSAALFVALLPAALLFSFRGRVEGHPTTFRSASTSPFLLGFAFSPSELEKDRGRGGLERTSFSRLKAEKGTIPPNEGTGVRRSAAVLQAADPNGKDGGEDKNINNKKKKQHSSSNKAISLSPPRGTRDFFPEDMRLRNWLFGHWRDVASLFGFEEFDAPVLESEDLYIRKAGEEVTQQLYSFEDRGGRRVALRPELTPSLARMVLAKRRQLQTPLKWWSIPQCWRYERMTRGRRREHYQWNMDIWGVPGVQAEAELLSAIVTFFRRVGLTSEDIGIKVNSRGVLRALLKKASVDDSKFAATCVLVDKLEKVPLEDLRGDFEALGYDAETTEKIAASVAPGRTLDSVLSQLQEGGGGGGALEDVRMLFEIAEKSGYADWLHFDPSVVRGLAYYTGTVFEAFDRQGELRAVCGGGRYDTLLETFGANERDALPAVGFGFGDAVIVELLKSKGKLPDFSSGSSVDALVFPFEKNQDAMAAACAQRLRERGIRTDLILDRRKPKAALKLGAKLGVPLMILIGEEESQKDVVRVKSMEDGTQADIPVPNLTDFCVEVLKKKEEPQR